jgi:hypothetical protein
MLKRPVAVGLFVLSALGSACLSELEPEVGDLRAGTCKSEDSDPAQLVSFQRDILPLFERSGSQGGCGCHNSSGRNTSAIEQSGLDLLDYRSLMRGGNNSQSDIVVAGDPCASVLVQKVSSAPPFGARMPPSGPPFMTPQEISLLRDWIYEGAHDN